MASFLGKIYETLRERIQHPTVESYALLAAVLSFLMTMTYFLLPFPKNYLSSETASIRIYDRDDILLMEMTPGESGLTSPVELDEVPDEFVELLLFSEDKNFYRHIGISFSAIVRAFFENLTAGETVSGGSTLSQQLVKLKHGYSRNNIFTKILEVFRAVRLEIHFSKDEILEGYLNRIYLGNQIYGIKKASEIYFDKDPDQLTLLEMSALISIIPAPSAYNIYDHLYTVEEKAKDLLFDAKNEGTISQEEYDIEEEDHLYTAASEDLFFAPHFCFYVLEEVEKILPKKVYPTEIYTTLDYELYEKFLNVARNQVLQLSDHNVEQSAMLMLDNKNMEILVMIGSVNYFSENGQINGTTSQIQPGSSMKPFTYALALESGRYTPSTILPDVYSEFPSAVGSYIPSNFDERYHGPVRLAVALGSSYNVPTVWLLNEIGVGNLYDFLKEAGFDSLSHPHRYYGLGLTLGSGDVSLLEEARAYSIFPNGGVLKETKSFFYALGSDGNYYTPEESEETELLSGETAFLISHILSDYSYKTGGFGANVSVHLPFEIALKTGTSKDFRDNTVLAYNEEYTFAVWMGNFSGDAMLELPSAAGAGLVLRDSLLALHNNGFDFGEGFSSEGLDISVCEICNLSGKKADEDCPETSFEYFLAGTEPTEECDWHEDGKIIFPDEYSEWARINYPESAYTIEENGNFYILAPENGSIYKISGALPAEVQNIRLEAVSASDDVDWFTNGAYFQSGKLIYLQLDSSLETITAQSEDRTYEISITVLE